MYISSTLITSVSIYVVSCFNVHTHIGLMIVWQWFPWIYRCVSLNLPMLCCQMWIK